MIELTEAQVKYAVNEYLETMMAMGKLYFERLNAGNFIEVRGETRRRIKGAKKGTSDFFVIQGGEGAHELLTFVTFVEVKSSKGKQSPDQLEFEEMITKYHCRYAVVRSVDELQEVLG
ncbi:hypothetical protein LCGC14_1729110 [marine sediment metagenome]|uniref:VRR-NUC domain-containing protein n=1 Tax=marine sediment metagenome TaxID=412755 RepID=A0A0F9K9V0_9ZZZZ